MSQGPDFTYGGGQFPDGRSEYPTGPLHPVARSNPAGQPAWDPVTGQPLPPGPPAYSAVDPFAPIPQGYPGHPAAPGYPGYPGYQAPTGYRLVPMYQMPSGRPPKPGAVVAAAVLAFIQAGFALLGGVVLVAGGTDGVDFSDRNTSLGTSFGGELTLIGCIAVLAAALLIGGGTTVLNKKPALLTVGGAMSIVISIYFVIRLSDVAYGGAIWLPIGYAVLPIIAIALTMSPDVRAWVRTRNTDAQ